LTSRILSEIRDTVEAELTALLPRQSELAPTLVAAMRYSALAGGKRLRPLLCCTTSLACGGTTAAALAGACAVEFLHSYSLIHDDLPAMDDDSLRRGKPTCHIEFDEAQAILAGDALQALAFQCLTMPALNPTTALDMVRVLAQAAGWQGMVGGQSLDLANSSERKDAMSENANELSQTRLEQLHAAKTGALLTASMHLGALAAEASPETIASVCAIGERLGLAFQVIDDVLDVTSTTHVLGKTAGSDAAQGKTTFVDLLGVEAARAYAIDLCQGASQNIMQLPGNTKPLSAAAKQVALRDR